MTPGPWFARTCCRRRLSAAAAHKEPRRAGCIAMQRRLALINPSKLPRPWYRR
jgi:hypothetical protein